MTTLLHDPGIPGAAPPLSIDKTEQSEHGSFTETEYYDDKDVSSIVGYERRGNRDYFQVVWAGFEQLGSPEWVPFKQLVCPVAMAKFIHQLYRDASVLQEEPPLPAAATTQQIILDQDTETAIVVTIDTRTDSDLILVDTLEQYLRPVHKKQPGMVYWMLPDQGIPDTQVSPEDEFPFISFRPLFPISPHEYHLFSVTKQISLELAVSILNSCSNDQELRASNIIYPIFSLPLSDAAWGHTGDDNDQERSDTMKQRFYGCLSWMHRSRRTLVAPGDDSNMYFFLAWPHGLGWVLAEHRSCVPQEPCFIMVRISSDAFSYYIQRKGSLCSISMTLDDSISSWKDESYAMNPLGPIGSQNPVAQTEDPEVNRMPGLLVPSYKRYRDKLMSLLYPLPESLTQSISQIRFGVYGPEKLYEIQEFSQHLVSHWQAIYIPPPWTDDQGNLVPGAKTMNVIFVHRSWLRYLHLIPCLSELKETKNHIRFYLFGKNPIKRNPDFRAGCIEIFPISGGGLVTIDSRLFFVPKYQVYLRQLMQDMGDGHADNDRTAKKTGFGVKWTLKLPSGLFESIKKGLDDDTCVLDTKQVVHDLYKRAMQFHHQTSHAAISNSDMVEFLYSCYTSLLHKYRFFIFMTIDGEASSGIVERLSFEEIFHAM